jgi:phage-related protein
MGFLKKIGKGLRKAFKKIGQGIKKAFKKFGKFMGKIGILGQLAMMFILPGIGGALLKGWQEIWHHLLVSLQVFQEVL